MAFLIETASFIAKKQIKNEELTQFPEKYRNMIFEKAGIASRFHVVNECTSDLAVQAINFLLKKTLFSPMKIEALICATSSPDRMQPATATRVQSLCGLKNAFAFDVNSVCSGGIYALRLANALIKDGLENVIVVAAEVYSKILNPKDITTFPYFGDGAAALLLSKNQGKYRLSNFILGSDGSQSDVIQVPIGGTMLPFEHIENKKNCYFKMDGPKVFEFAVEKGTEIVNRLLNETGKKPDRVVLHQANKNILLNIAERTGLEKNIFFMNMEKYANMAAASSLVALDESFITHPKDKTIFLVAFGGGLSWGGCMLEV